MVDNKIFLEEEKKLKEISKVVIEKLEESEQKFEEQKHTIISIGEGMRGAHFTRQSLMNLYATEIFNLKLLKNSPYFGKLIFKSNEELENRTIYIGKRSLIDGSEILIYDWRSPIASMYYNYSIGDAEYQKDNLKVKGKILNKRQIQIENGILLDVEEHDTLTDDKILIKYLKGNADSRLKSIIATIQKEQNEIIRCSMKNHYFIQGVAGSGKTTVALHRIAYLIYNEAKNIKESEFMILGPNKYFLNYISALLPDLDIHFVAQNTFEEIALQNIGEKVKLETQNQTLQNVLLGVENEKIINYKSSLEFLELIQSFISTYLECHLKKPIMYEGIKLCEENYLNGLVDFNYIRKSKQSYNERINNIIKLVVSRVKENKENLSSRVWAKNREEFLSLPKDSPRRKEIIEIITKQENEIKNGCQKTIKKAFSFVKTSPLKLYESFIENLNDEILKNPEINCEELKEQTLNRLKKKKIGHDDLAAIMLIKYLLVGIKEYENYGHIVIDEGQDLSIGEYSILKLLFPKATFDIYGDLNQSIYAYQGISSWQELNNYVFSSKGVHLDLNKGYRTTKPITDASKYILNEFDIQNVDCIGRDGENVSINKVNDDISSLLLKIDELLNKKYKTIAIICKDSIETDKIYNKLNKKGLNIHKISESDLSYNGGLCIMPSYLSKGLEFDAVIVNDASENIYNHNSMMDMKLLYVSMTRPLHELHINYYGELTKPLQEMIKEEQKQLIKK